MDPNLTQPIILNAPINATLLQPPQPFWTSNVMSAVITSIVTILAVYLGQQWGKNAEKERNVIKSRRQAYYKYISTFSKVSKRREEWTPESKMLLISDLWKVALEVGEFGNLFFENEITISQDDLGFEDTYYLQLSDGTRLKPSVFLRPLFGVYFGGEIPPEGLVIKSLHDYINVLEFLQIHELFKPDKIILYGQLLFPIIRKELLKAKM